MFSSQLRREDIASFWIEGDVEFALCFARFLVAMFLGAPVVATMHFQTRTVHYEHDWLVRRTPVLGDLQPLATPRKR